MDNISKEFSGVRVLNDVNFNLRAGEVHVLIGENGAGKSTLMKILAGVYQKTSGEIKMADENGKLAPMEIEGPMDALEKGVSMVFQEFNLMENMSIYENIAIGFEPMKHGIVDKRVMVENARKLLEQVNMNDVSPTRIVETLTVAQKQCVEIAKCLSHNAKIIILDEPTSSLSETEVNTLFKLIRSLKSKGIGIIYISHRMQEIFEISDRITVFRDGQLIDTLQTKETSEKKLVQLMIGRRLTSEESNADKMQNPEILFSCNEIYVKKFDTRINMDIHKGEIVGLFGLVGAGRTEFVQSVFGIDDKKGGKVSVNGREIKIRNPSDAIKSKIGFLPEDRRNLGLILKHNVLDNLTLVKLRDLPWVLKSRTKENEITKEYIEKLSIATKGIMQCVERLSGGNQQKVAISKWLTLDLDVLIMDEPTRGVDVGAKADIYSLMNELAAQGKCVLMISSDLPEILRVSHRVIVMHDGEIKMDKPVGMLNQELIMNAAIS